MVRTVAILNNAMVTESDTVKCKRNSRGKATVHLLVTVVIIIRIYFIEQ